MSALIALLVLAGHCVASERQSGTAYVIALRPHASVPAGVVRLADIADISGPSESVCTRLGQLDIDDAPRSGQLTTVSTLQITFRLQLTGIRPSACRVEGTRCVVRGASANPQHADRTHEQRSQQIVRTAFTSIPQPQADSQQNIQDVDRLQAMLTEQLRQLAERSTNKTPSAARIQLAGHEQAATDPDVTGTPRRLASSEDVSRQINVPTSPREQVSLVARNAVLDRLPWDRKDVQIDVSHIGLKTATEAVVRRGVLSPEIRSAWPPLGRVQVVVRAVSGDGSDAAEIPVVLNVRYFQNVVVAKRRVKRGAVIEQADVYLDRQEVRDMASILTTSESVVGMTAGRDILPLNLIRPGDVKNTATVRSQQPAVRRGSTVKLIVRGGGLAISVLSEAMQDGRPGDVIRVKNLDSQQIRTGKVLNANEVEVQF